MADTSVFMGTPMTKREIFIAREAFVAACRVCTSEVPQWEWQARQTAESRYPLPKVKRPRIVTDPHKRRDRASYYDWTVRNGELHFRWSKADDGDWKMASGAFQNLLLTPTPERVAMWADLLANPTEEVDAD